VTAKAPVRKENRGKQKVGRSASIRVISGNYYLEQCEQRWNTASRSASQGGGGEEEKVPQAESLLKRLVKVNGKVPALMGIRETARALDHAKGKGETRGRIRGGENRP